MVQAYRAGEPAPSGNVWDTNIFTGTANQFSSGRRSAQLDHLPLFQPGLAVLGDVPGEAPLPPPQSPVYSFSLDQGESATIAIESLNGKKLSFSLYDDNGDVLAVSAPARPTTRPASTTSFPRRTAPTTSRSPVTPAPSSTWS